MQKLSVRVSQHDKAFWYDLSDKEWRAVRVTPGAWEIVKNPPSLFYRYSHQLPQAEPKKDGDISLIFKYINIKEQHTLFVCWLVSCFIPGIPHAMPVFFGEKGAAKTTASEMVKMLIDPSSLSTLTLANDPRQMAVNLQQHYFLPFDNVSHINEETSDTLCRAVSGGGIQQRKLFTNAEDTIFTFKRCISINGINNVATRPDLLDRSLLIELERIHETNRREISEIQASFEADRPAILGGIFDLVSKAMEIYPTVKLDKLPRMADFAKWSYAVGEALGGQGQKFLDEYADNRNSQNTEAINSDSVATLVVAFMNNREEWTGKVSDLLTNLSDLALQHGVNPRSKSFPTQPNHLSRWLRGIKSNLEAAGISFETRTKMQGTIISLSRKKSSPLPPLSPYNAQIPHNTDSLGHGDNMVINSKHGDNDILSPCGNTRNNADYGGHGDYGDKFVEVTDAAGDPDLPTEWL